jgi:glycosyltransferase involved in cell wall biosynthesis
MGARSLQAVAYARWTRTPVAVWAMLSEHTEQHRSRLQRAARRWLVKRADAIIVNGESGARYFHGFGVPDEKLLRVHQTLDMTPFLALSLNAGEKETAGALRLLHVGSLSERKGVRQLVSALKTIADAGRIHRPVHLTFVGDGPLRSELETVCHTIPQGQQLQIVFTGPVPYNELPKYYAEADVLLFPSLGDEWGLVVNEALAAGGPVLGSTYAQAVSELLRDGVNGWVFGAARATDPKSWDAGLTAGLERVLETDAFRLHEMKHAARASVRELTPEHAAARIVQRLREVAR